jgi:hypothetical protein
MHIMQSALLLAVGIASIAIGMWSVWRGIRTDTFQGGPGGTIRYHESRSASPVNFWGAIAYRLALVPFGIWMIYLALWPNSN